MPASTSPAAHFEFLLKSADRPLRDLDHLDRGELEALQAAVAQTLTRIAANQAGSHLNQEISFPCEWWPPN